MTSSPELANAGAVTDVELSAQLIDSAIRMTRFTHGVDRDGGAAAFSPDGSKIATVVWRGDIERNCNEYTLLVVDLGQLDVHHDARAVPVLSVDYTGDSAEYFATPITQLTFAADNRTLAFLGTLHDEPRQVHVIDVETGERRQLTDEDGGVSCFTLAPDGSLAVYGARVTGGVDPRWEAAERDGVLVRDRELFPEALPFKTGEFVLWPKPPRSTVEYVLSSGDQRERTVVFDSRRNAPPRVNDDATTAWGSLVPSLTLADEHVIRAFGGLTADPVGRYALLWPYAPEDRFLRAERYAHYYPLESFRLAMAAPYGLVDLATGSIEVFLDAPYPGFDEASGGAIWSPDGSSVVLYTLRPITPGAQDTAADERPAWFEVDVATRNLRQLDLPDGWRVMSWPPGGGGLVLGKGRQLARLPRRADGSWAPLEPLGSTVGFQPFRPEPVTNGKIVVGRVEAPDQPPELAVRAVTSGDALVVTDLNRDLRNAASSPVEELHWSGRLTESSGYLVTPQGYEPGTRYPLAVLFDDGVLLDASPYLIDGGGIHLSGHPIQALAARGIAVLYLRTPDELHELIGSNVEGDHILDHVESGIAHVDALGLIDVGRLALSGWSWAAYKTDYTLMHSSYTFAAATHIDIDPVDHANGRRPFTDEQLRRIRTPLLVEAHSPISYISSAAMADRLNALGGLAELLYFPTAPHSVIAPRHRRRSLKVHLDWFSFWLNGTVDPDPALKSQYERWSCR